jgi:hypothetical protein
MGTFGRRVSVGLAIAALSAAGSAMFGGVALAGEDHGDHHGDHNNEGGKGGGGGDTKVFCAIPIGVSGAILGQSDDVSQCNAYGGNGGDGGDGADY